MTSRLLSAALAAGCALALSQNALAANSGGVSFCPEKGRMVSVVEFEASWCEPCRAMKPAWEKLAKDYKGKLSIVHIDIDRHPDIAAGMRISAVPTQMVFDKQCNFLDAHSGYLSESDLRSTVENLLKLN